MSTTIQIEIYSKYLSSTSYNHLVTNLHN